MTPESNPLGVGWVNLYDPEQAHELEPADLLSDTGLYRPVEAPACGRTKHIEAEWTTDDVARTFVCDRPAGHDGRCRHIYTGEAELTRDQHELAEAWWAEITWQAAS